MKLKFLAAVAAFAIASPALAQTVVNSAPAAGFRYGSGNDYTPANAVVSTTEANELALRFHIRGVVAPASDANAVYSFALGSTPLNFDWSLNGSRADAILTFTNLLTNAQFSYSPFLPGNDNYSGGMSNPNLFQNSNQLNFLPIGFNPNQDNTYRAVFTAGGNSVTAFARIGAGAPAVPEPATWAMMLVGFGGMGVAMRRNRRRTVTALQVA